MPENLRYRSFNLWARSRAQDDARHAPRRGLLWFHVMLATVVAWAVNLLVPAPVFMPVLLTFVGVSAMIVGLVVLFGGR